METPSKIKRLVLAACAAIGVTAGAATMASAATSPSPTPNAPVVHEQPTKGGQSDTNDTADSPSYQSSVTVAQTPDTHTGSDNESADSAKLAPLAKVTPEQATAAAIAKVPGTAGNVHLEDENGNVVYGVDVTAADGTTSDVKVDAGNGAVLSHENGGDAGKETGTESGKEANDVAESATETPGGK